MTCPKLELVAWPQNSSGPIFLEAVCSQTVDRGHKIHLSLCFREPRDGRWTHQHSQTFQKRVRTAFTVCGPKVPTLILLLGCPWQLLKAHNTLNRRRESSYPTHIHLHFPDSQKKLFIISNKKSLAHTSTPPDIHRECLHKRQWGLPPKIDYSTKSPILGTLHLPQNRAIGDINPQYRDWIAGSHEVYVRPL